MQINVAQLLRTPIGTVRQFPVNEVIAIVDDGSGSQVQGDVRLMRTEKGILVEGNLHIGVELTCSRCLGTFPSELDVNFAEEYLPSIDVASGLPLPAPDEPDTFMIDDHHTIDLDEAIRQYALLVIPMKPLCQENCAGICPQCGQNLNRGSCDCATEVLDPRWAKLTALRHRR